MKKIIWIVTLVLLLIGLYFLFTQTGPKIDPPLEAGILHSLDNVKGNVRSSVVLMEYSDFECPACRTYYIALREVMQEFGDQIVFVYRHFPLNGIHLNAEFAARAAEAAREQGKFWEMHDLLFEKQSEWAKSNNVEEIFVAYAKLLDLDIEKFKIDWKSDNIKNFVAAQRVHALRSGLQGTPSFFLNGKLIQNPGSVDEFRKIIREAL